MREGAVEALALGAVARFGTLVGRVSGAAAQHAAIRAWYRAGCDVGVVRGGAVVVPVAVLGLVGDGPDIHRRGARGVRLARGSAGRALELALLRRLRGRARCIRARALVGACCGRRRALEHALACLVAGHRSARLGAHVVITTTATITSHVHFGVNLIEDGRAKDESCLVY